MLVRKFWIGGMYLEQIEKIDPIKLGNLIRQIRKKKGKRLTDLEDDYISAASISNIERGKATLKSPKVAYLCKKLKIDAPTIESLADDDHDKEDFLFQQLLGLEAIIEFDPDFALECLAKITLTYLDELSVYAEYLIGKAYSYKRSWTNSKNHFLKAIEIVDGNPALQQTNYKAMSLIEISRIYYFTNNPEQALEYAEKSCESFQANGNRPETKFVTLVCKAIYLDDLGRRDSSIGKHQEALEVVEEVIAEQRNITNIDALLSAYELKADLLRNLQLPEKALPCALDGLKIARANQSFDRSVDLWTELGQIYLDIGNVQKAKSSLETAIRFKRVVPERRFMITYTTLGHVYAMEENWVEAEKYFQMVIDLITPDTPVTRYIDAYIGLADCYLSHGQYTAALEMYQFSLKKCKEHELYQKENYVSIKRCECAAKLDETLFNKYLKELFSFQLRQLKIRP
jgi:tetratricopeptide (TPR) repeat protein